MILEASEYVKTLEMSYTETGGLDQVIIESSTGQSITAGAPRSSANQTKKLDFDYKHRLIGLKGLSRSDLLDSLGAIVFDHTCDISNPTTKIAESKVDENKTETEIATEPEVKVVTEQP